MIEALPNTYASVGPNERRYRVDAWDDDGRALTHDGRGRLVRVDEYDATLRERERAMTVALATSASGPRPF